MRNEQSPNNSDILFVSSSQTRANTRNNINLLSNATTRNNSVSRSQCNDIELSRTGEVTVVYNTSALSVFTIFVINNNSTSITGYSQISPDGVHFKTQTNSVVTIEPDEVEIFVGKIYACFTSIVLNGPPYGHVRIYIQGQTA